MTQQEYAGFWVRSLATGVDFSLTLLLFSGPLFLLDDSPDWELQPAQLKFDPVDLLSHYLLPFLITVGFWLRFLATPGKLLTGLKIVDANTGSRMHLRQAVIRYISYPLAMLPLGLGIFWILRDRKKQGWHDKLAGTVVIRERRVSFPIDVQPGPG
ncbi:RDD family protein [Neptuniibacter sp. CAU 1671]|uniref:RDD family protein n=1 Tax=Neptuniibacter sp. CAU 1671 TaxID=3032593 RepID=UPI0023D9FD7F|nr:RDD family protein [Neptuniibacter sp. CAU 1671]MDF2182512.1 RDD family protein [Neptuniibacter sp. CAU 1671]